MLTDEPLLAVAFLDPFAPERPDTGTKVTNFIPFWNDITAVDEFSERMLDIMVPVQIPFDNVAYALVNWLLVWLTVLRLEVGVPVKNALERSVEPPVERFVVSVGDVEGRAVRVFGAVFRAPADVPPVESFRLVNIRRVGGRTVVHGHHVEVARAVHFEQPFVDRLKLFRPIMLSVIVQIHRFALEVVADEIRLREVREVFAVAC
jgi:hypothetical protein